MTVELDAAHRRSALERWLLRLIRDAISSGREATQRFHLPAFDVTIRLTVEPPAKKATPPPARADTLSE